jgi:hypothetical protein
MTMNKKLIIFILTSDMVFLKYFFILLRDENIRLGVVVDISNVHTILIIINIQGIRKYISITFNKPFIYCCICQYIKH